MLELLSRSLRSSGLNQLLVCTVQCIPFCNSRTQLSGEVGVFLRHQTEGLILILGILQRFCHRFNFCASFCQLTYCCMRVLSRLRYIRLCLSKSEAKSQQLRRVARRWIHRSEGSWCCGFTGAL